MPAEYHVDVLVLGGGPAGTWAATSASAKGAKVLLADKGFCGTSGATAPSGTRVWIVDPISRERVKSLRLIRGEHLNSNEWMESVLHQTYNNIKRLDAWGYPFPIHDNQSKIFDSLQGPEYMRVMRKCVKKYGATILDHSPALGLLTNSFGAVCGAHGINRQTNETWTVYAKSVVMATGGCAFMSKVIGCLGLTGDGLLMSAEVGAELSGMEFSNRYGISPEWSTITKAFYYDFATYYKEDGTVINDITEIKLAELLLKEKVYLKIDKVDEEIKKYMRSSQPNFWLQFDRMGIDPFTDKFPITLRLEGSVRGTGGVNIKSKKCETSVAGLFAAGDVATREPVSGAYSGGGDINSAWAISSGFWAGNAAADYSKTVVEDTITLQQPIKDIDVNLAYKVIKEEVLPLDKNFFRNQESMEKSIEKFNKVWNSSPTAPVDPVKNKEALSLIAVARWMYSSALIRKESRGMHIRTDYPNKDPKQTCRYIITGVEDVIIKPHD
jgi:succinate dehydrogenase/fumarate reductase flavoprotein subunit